MMQESRRKMASWRKSSASNPAGCIEVRTQNRAIRVRDSKNPSGLHLSFTYAEWRAFLSGVTLGKFALPEARAAEGPRRTR